MGKKKIVFYHTGLGQGGISTALVSLLTELSKDNSLEITLLLGRKVNDSRFEIPSRIQVIFMPDTLSLWLESAKSSKGIRKLYCYFVHFIGLNFGIKFIKSRILTEYYGTYDIAINYVNDIPKMNIDYFGNDIILNCVKANKRITWIHNDPYQLGITREYALCRYKNFDAVVNVSKGNKDKFDQICPEYSYKSRLVYNCIYLEEKVIPEEKWSRDGKFHIISVSRLDNKQKRIDRIIECCEELKKRGYKEKIVWHLFGSGPDEKMLKRLAAEKSVGDILMFEGMTKTPLEVMAKADIYVLTSDYEGFGLTVLEALAEELPVIVTKFAEAKESVLDERNGYLVDFNAEDICDKIELLMNDRKTFAVIKEYICENPIDNKIALEQFYGLINEDCSEGDR